MKRIIFWLLVLSVLISCVSVFKTNVEKINSAKEAINIDDSNELVVRYVGNVYQYLKTNENLLYSDNKVTDYNYNKYIFRRYKNGISIFKENDSEKNNVMIKGYDFVLSEKNGKLWFTDVKRMICSFDYTTFNFENGDLDEKIVVYESSDLYDINNYTCFRYKNYEELEKKVAITSDNIPYTAIVDENKVCAYGRKYCDIANCIYSLDLPFKIVAISDTYIEDNSNQYRVNFITDMNAIGVLLFSADKIDFKIIDDSDGEKSLISESSDISICTQKDWVIYEKNNKIVASNGEKTFSFNTIKYTKMQNDDICGIGKRYGEDATFIIKTNEEDFENMTIDELEGKYVI